MLTDVKSAFDCVLAHREIGAKERERLGTQLATCESSDGFWWLGDSNPADAVSDFERLFRRQLRQLYLHLGEEPPTALSHLRWCHEGEPTIERDYRVAGNNLRKAVSYE